MAGARVIFICIFAGSAGQARPGAGSGLEWWSRGPRGATTSHLLRGTQGGSGLRRGPRSRTPSLRVPPGPGQHPRGGQLPRPARRSSRPALRGSALSRTRPTAPDLPAPAGPGAAGLTDLLGRRRSRRRRRHLPAPRARQCPPPPASVRLRHGGGADGRAHNPPRRCPGDREPERAARRGIPRRGIPRRGIPRRAECPRPGRPPRAVSHGRPAS